MPQEDASPPRLPVLTEQTLVAALTGRLDGRGAPDGNSPPWGERLPSPAQLVALAIAGPPPTPLHEEFQQRVGQALSALALAAGALAAAAGALSLANSFSAFQQTGLTSSDPSAITGSATSGARPARYAIGVERLATAQENSGSPLPAGAAVALAPGCYPIELRQGGAVRRIVVDVVDETTNAEMLNTLAAAINQAGLRLWAGISQPAAGLVQIVLRATETGLDAGFSLSDTAGGPIALSGVGRVALPATDAVYRLNGVRTVSPSNTAMLQGGKVRISLLRPTRGLDHDVSVGPDRPAVVEAVELLMQAERVLAEIVRDRADVLAPSFTSDFMATVTAVAPSLEALGVSVDASGQLIVDGARLRDQAERDPGLVEDAVAGADGAAQRLGQFAADVISSPISRFAASRYIPPIPPATSHPTPTMLLASHTLSALLYAQLFAQGLYVNAPS